MKTTLALAIALCGCLNPPAAPIAPPEPLEGHQTAFLGLPGAPATLAPTPPPRGTIQIRADCDTAWPIGYTTPEPHTWFVNASWLENTHVPFGHHPLRNLTDGTFPHGYGMAHVTAHEIGWHHLTQWEHGPGDWDFNTLWPLTLKSYSHFILHPCPESP